MVALISMRVLLLTACVAALSACAPAPRAQTPSAEAPAQASGPKRITAAIPSLNPGTLRSSDWGRGGGNTPGVDVLEDLANSGATRRDDTDTLRPVLAEALPSLENGGWKVFPDGRMETTFTLKPGVRWQDGTVFTTRDLLFSVAVCTDREMITLGFGNGNIGLDLIDGAQASDDRTITVTWKQPFIEADALFTTELVMPIPRHLLEGTYQENKRGLIDLPYWTHEFVGTGPFQVRDWVDGTQIFLTAFDGYILGRPRVDEILVKFIPDSNALVANMLAGEIDVNLGRGMSLDQALQIRDLWTDGRLEVGLGNWVETYPQFVNPQPIVLLDVRFRKGLIHALDRQEMTDELQGGLVPIAHSYFNTSLPKYRDVDAFVVKYDYDPRKAVQLIESTGYARGADGFFRDSVGQRLSLEIRVTGSQEIQTKSMFSVANYWQRIGIAVETVIEGPQRRNDREYRATRPAFELAQLPGGTKWLRRAYSSETPLPENNFTKTSNPSRYMNPEFDGMMDRFFATIPRRERMQALGQILRHSSDLVTNIGLFYGSYPTMVSNRLKGVDARKAEEGTMAWNVHEWDVL